MTFWGGQDFFDPLNLGVKKVEAPSKCPEKWLIMLLSQKKNYVPEFLKQRYIGILCLFANMGPQLCLNEREWFLIFLWCLVVKFKVFAASMKTLSNSKNSYWNLRQRACSGFMIYGYGSKQLFRKPPLQCTAVVLKIVPKATDDTCTFCTFADFSCL